MITITIYLGVNTLQIVTTKREIGTLINYTTFLHATLANNTKPCAIYINQRPVGIQT